MITKENLSPRYFPQYREEYEGVSVDVVQYYVSDVPKIMAINPFCRVVLYVRFISGTFLLHSCSLVAKDGIYRETIMDYTLSPEEVELVTGMAWERIAKEERPPSPNPTNIPFSTRMIEAHIQSLYATRVVMAGGRTLGRTFAQFLAQNPYVMGP